MKQNFIYVLKCPESGAIRYVGKGVNLKSRFRQHLSEARTGGRSHKCDWIRSLLRRGLKPVMQIDEAVPEGECWKEVEHRRVLYFRNLGCNLTNATDGGDEPGELSEEGRRILSERASQTFGTPEGRAKQSLLMKKLCSDPEWLRQRTEAGRRTKATPEYRAKQAERSRSLWNRPGFRERASEARKALARDPAFIKRLSASVSAAQSSPEVRARLAIVTKRCWQDPAHRAMRIERIKAGRSHT